ncbi:MAG: MBL fold metallo-hydrolase [Endomicrobiaceae bacterium]|jgi:glyoxylase-like metal-dependent hydrolase (beta-lactamase superfamily II)|nr:MBL fold metallo-hydrolase [Endomicrobiaceae bacterium]MDD3729650.1 MBL fold metallo-hydrolase [Endomicrobiaceae bacterium]MDD4165884.1 MBL fold metallo-hydrolase [Endomicrobiaceae bacterium]
MIRLFLSFMFTFLFCLSPLFSESKENRNFAKNIIEDITVFSLIESAFEHPKDLFLYPGSAKVLASYLAKPNSTKSTVTFFLAITPDFKILFDTGSDPNVLLKRLNEIQINPDQINFVCITHMHPDHIGGLINAKGTAVFTNAEIFIPKREADFNSNNKIFEIYGDAIKIFDTNEEIIKRVKPIPAYGHTSGQTMYKMTTKGKSVLFWGDILHAPVQFSKPDIYTHYDNNPKETVAIRKDILEQVSKDKTIIAGVHIAYPALGTVSKTKDGYKFMPLAAGK